MKETERRVNFQLTGAWRSGRGPGAPLRCICYCLSERQYQYLSTIQINPFRTSTSRSAPDSQSSQFNVKIISLSALAEVGANTFFRQGPNPFSAALAIPALEVTVTLGKVI